MLNRYVITGGGGAGKTSLLNALASKGFATFPEVSRQIIQEQQKQGGNIFPWENLWAFGQECLLRMHQQICQCPQQITFFDRGIPDIQAYFRVGNIDCPPLAKTAEGLYNPKVFICPPWQQIFVNDAQRPESFEYTQQIYSCLTESYKQQGYQLVVVPKVSIEERVGFVLDRL